MTETMHIPTLIGVSHNQQRRPSAQVAVVPSATRQMPQQAEDVGMCNFFKWGTKTARGPTGAASVLAGGVKYAEVEHVADKAALFIIDPQVDFHEGNMDLYNRNTQSARQRMDDALQLFATKFEESMQKRAEFDDDGSMEHAVSDALNAFLALNSALLSKSENTRLDETAAALQEAIQVYIERAKLTAQPYSSQNKQRIADAQIRKQTTTARHNALQQIHDAAKMLIGKNSEEGTAADTSTTLLHLADVAMKLFGYIEGQTEPIYSVLDRLVPSFQTLKQQHIEEAKSALAELAKAASTDTPSTYVMELIEKLNGLTLEESNFYSEEYKAFAAGRDAMLQRQGWSMNYVDKERQAALRSWKLLNYISVQIWKESFGGSLSVPNSSNDASTIARAIRTNIDTIGSIVVSLDAHHINHIANPNFWEKGDGNGGAPDAFTTITHQDVEKGVWKARDPNMQKWAEYYIEELGKQNQFKHTVWPEHCIVGTPGQAVVTVIMDALTAWTKHKPGRTITWVRLLLAAIGQCLQRPTTA